MNKRILISLSLIAVIAAVAVGVTVAYFTSRVDVTANVLSTGTLEISDTSDAWMRGVTFPAGNNLKPGDSVRKWVVLENTGSLDIDYLRIFAVNKTGDTGLLNQIRASVYAQVPGYDQGIYTPSWGTGQPVNSHLTGVDILGTAVYRDATAAKILAPGEKITVIIDFKVPTTVGNSWQGKSVTFDLRFDAEQVH